MGTFIQNGPCEASCLKKQEESHDRLRRSNVTRSVVTQRPTLDSFQKRHARALARALSDIMREFRYSRENVYEVLLVHYEQQFQQVSSDATMKEIKKMINYWCACRLRQAELPEKPAIRLWPRSVVVWVKHMSQLRSSGGKRQRYRFIHSVAQCKGVLEGPNKAFFKEAYLKHAATLSKPAVSTPEDILDLAYEKGKAFGEIVNRYYDPYRGFAPSGSATYDVKRSMGGKRGVLFKKNTMPFSAFRCAPTVLLLHGNPGVGKSRLVMDICRYLAQLENVEFDGSVFIRNCNTPHWDGYKGQFVTVLDDWSQDLTLFRDVPELIALESDNSYPLPMADLKEKGTTFTSRYLILCSNVLCPDEQNFPLDTVNGKRAIRSSQALARRFHYRRFIEDARSTHVTFNDQYEILDWTNPSYEFPVRGLSKSKDRTSFITDLCKELRDDSLKRQLGFTKSMYEQRLEYPWTQAVYNVDEVFNVNGHECRVKDDLILRFPARPPLSIPRVRVSAVDKPLGARMVTMGDADLHALKPLQVAMWRALGDFEKFKPTHGVPLQECLTTLGQLDANQIILSGDYEAATDGMNMDLSNSLLHGILSQIHHLPTELWAEYENGEHEVVYPPWTGIAPIVQTTGQLMGSLLSFPLLCLANDLITDLAGIKEQKIINGDDLLCHCTREQAKLWGEYGTTCGMKPSVGKNYISREFGTFNSQLLLRNELVPYVNLRLAYRNDTLGSCAKYAQLAGISKDLLVRRSKQTLGKTPASIDVSVEKGGLGLNTTKPDDKISIVDKLCYFTKLIKSMTTKYKSLGLPRGYDWLVVPTWDHSDVRLHGVPSDKLTAMRLDQMSSLKLEAATTNVKDTITWSDISRTKKLMLRNKRLRDLFYNCSFSKLPKIQDVGSDIIITTSGSKKLTYTYLMTNFVNKACLYHDLQG